MAETQKGGAYRVDDKVVNAEGAEVKITSKASTEPPVNESVLTEDFPGYPALVKAKLTTYASLEGKSREDLIAIPYVGDKTADEILAALAKRNG
jgi:DNA uptake protein ComE-like DNA-binding protein